MRNLYILICLILFQFKASAETLISEDNHLPNPSLLICDFSDLSQFRQDLISISASVELGSKAFSIDYIEGDIEYKELLLLGFLCGLVLIFFVLSVLSKIKPFLLSSFWFMSLLLLYMWRSGFAVILFPSLEASPYGEIYFFVLQSVPLIVYLISTKAVTVLQTRDYEIFQRIFTIFLRLSIAYLALVVFTSFINVNLITNNFKTIQGVFWVFLGLLGIPSLAWLVLSSRKNLNFYKFQTSFALLFLIALIGKTMLSPSDFPSAFLKPKHLLFGIMVQLAYMFWLLLTEVFKNLGLQNEGKDLAVAQDKIIKIGGRDKPIANLSPCELDIFTAYCNGFSYSEISSSFLISPNTVKTHLKNCYRKLEINSKVEAISIMNANKS